MDKLWRGVRRSFWRPAVVTLMTCGAVVLVHASRLEPAGAQNAAPGGLTMNVGVVDDQGQPITTLKPGQFEVSIGGHKRKVASADLVSASPPAPNGPGRVIVIAVDNASFAPGGAKTAMADTAAFLAKLPASDLVGLYTYPSGPRVNPTTDRNKVSEALAAINGQGLALTSQFHMRLSEIIDVAAGGPGSDPFGMSEPQIDPTSNSNADPMSSSTQSIAPAGRDNEALSAVQKRECASTPGCASRIYSEAFATVGQLQAVAEQSVSSLQGLLRSLATVPGQKTIVVVSAGLITSDRSGNRPDVGQASKGLAQDAARAHATVYTVYAGQGGGGMAAANSQTMSGSQRDRDILRRWLSDMSSAAGGAFLEASDNAGAFDRLVRETGAHYRLTFEPAKGDDSDKPQEVKIKVNQRGADVRSPAWIVTASK